MKFKPQNNPKVHPKMLFLARNVIEPTVQTCPTWLRSQGLSMTQFQSLVNHCKPHFQTIFLLLYVLDYPTSVQPPHKALLKEEAEKTGKITTLAGNPSIR